MARARTLLVLLLCGVGPAAPTSAQPEGPAPGGSEDAAATEQSVQPEPTAEDEIRAKLDDFERLREEITALVPQVEAAEGEERTTLGFQLRDRWMEAIRIGHTLAEALVAAEERGLEVGGVRARVEGALRAVSRGIPFLMDRVDAHLAALSAARESAEGEEADALQARIGEGRENRSLLYLQYLDHLGDLRALGLDTAAPRKDLEARLEARAEDLSGRIRVRARELARARAREQAKSDDPERAEAVRVAELRLDQVAVALRETVAVMAALGLDTARYDRVLIESTGEISGAIFDREVASGLLEQWTDAVKRWARANVSTLLFRLLLFGLVLLVTGAAARVTRHVVERAVAGPRSRLTQLARAMLTAISGRIVWFLGILVAVSQLGVEIGPLLAGLGVAGFIIGFALQDTLGNFASGAMLLIYRPYDVGDMVEVAGGVFGSVSQQSLVSTTILTIDNQTLVIPNSRIWGDVIKNVTAQKRRRVDLVFNVSYQDDVHRAQRIFESILEEHPKVLEDPPPMVKIHELGDWSIRFIVRPWVGTGDYWEVYWDVTREVKLRFDREGLRIPVPRRDVHVHAGDAGAKAGTAGGDRAEGGRTPKEGR